MSSFKDLDAFLEEFVKIGPAGLGCAVGKDGEIIYEKYLGYSDLDKKTPITADSIYRQFSATKVVICTAAMMLFERGKFLLNDPIYDYFPEWKNTMVAEKQEDGSYIVRPAKRPILVKDCFSMSMGLGYLGEEYPHVQMTKAREELRNTLGKYTLRQDIQAVSKAPIMFDPGSHWLYGFGHEMVAGLIEVVSGMKVSEFLQKEMFDPLGMTSTGYRYFGDTRERMVTPYEKGPDNKMTKTVGMFDEYHEPDAIYEAGGAGLFSTVADYVKFSQMLACGGSYKGERIMGRKTIDLMRQNQLTPEQLKDFECKYNDGYGYGLGVRTLMDPSRSGNSSIGEFGWTGYMGTYVEIDPSEKLSVVYMHNMIPNMEEYVHLRVRNLAFGCIK